MAAKDIATKEFESMDDVFADIVNVLLFDGEEVVQATELEYDRTYSSYGGEDRLRFQDRDVAKFWNKNCMRLASFGFENETVSEDGMPYRVIGYDGASYRDQIRTYTDAEGKRHKKITRYPVVTLVLHMDYKKRWDKPRTIHEMLGDSLDEKLRPYVHDYPINLFELAFLSDEKVKKFKSDFGILVDYLVQMRKTGNYVPPTREITHVREMLNMMSAVTDDDRFAKTYEEVIEGKEPKNMCTVLDRIENKGRDEGREEGREEGRKEGRKEGREEGRKENQVEMTKFMSYMFDQGRVMDLEKASKDESLMEKMLEEFRMMTKTMPV